MSLDLATLQLLLHSLFHVLLSLLFSPRGSTLFDASHMRVFRISSLITDDKTLMKTERMQRKEKRTAKNGSETQQLGEI